MPLSEHEEKMLAQMERALLEEDPRFASRLRRQSVPRASRRNAIIGLIGVVLGLALVILAAIQSMPLIGGVGFVVMVLAGATMARPSSTTLGSVQDDGSVRTHTSGGFGAPRPQGNRRGAGRSGSFMNRLEERWDRRRNERW